MTLPEKKLWEALRKLDLNIRRQSPIGPYIADFACHSAALVVEVDGPWHDFEDRQIDDITRTAWLEGQGYRVLRFGNQQVLEDLEAVVAQVAAVASPPSPTLPPSRGKGETR